MPFIPADNVAQAELIYTWQGETVENVLHYLPDVALSSALMGELASLLVTQWASDFQALMPTTLSLVNVRMTNLSAADADGFDWGIGLPLVGTRTGTGTDSLPNSIALCITKVTAFRGRTRRGRIYHPGLAENQVVGNAVAVTSLPAILAAYADLIELVTAGATWNMQVISRRLNNDWRVEALVTPVVSMRTDGVIDSQRRRLPGRGQ